jgi:hypothetical protein
MRGKYAPPALEREIARLAARQHGTISREQLLRLGLGAPAVDHRLQSLMIVPLHRGVYALGLPSGTREERWMAAVLACGEGAVLSHLSAAALLRLRDTDRW